MANLFVLYPQNFQETQKLGIWLDGYATLAPFNVIKPRLFHKNPISPMPTIESDLTQYTHILLVYWRSKNKPIDPVYSKIYHYLLQQFNQQMIAVIEVTTDKEIHCQSVIASPSGNPSPIFFSTTKHDILHDPYSRVSFMQFIEEFTQHNAFK